MEGGSYEVSERTRVRRLKDRGRYDRATLHAILDEALVAHVGFCPADGQPLVLPMGYARVGETLNLHGSITNAMLKAMKGEPEVCVTVTLLVVVARTAFSHSLNYRSVVAQGRAHAVTEPQEKAAALDAITEAILPGRTQEVRPNSSAELNATAVLALELGAVSAKVRTGGPHPQKDVQLPDVWAGELPFAPLATLPAIPCEQLLPGIPVPRSVADYRRARAEAHLAV